MINKYGKRCCRPDCNSVWASLPCCLSKGLLKRDFLDLYLITFLGEGYFKNTSAMTVIFLKKSSKFNVYFKNVGKNREKFFCFKGNSIWSGSINLSLFRREYLSSAVNMLTDLIFCIALKETFLNSITFTVMNRYAKGAVLQIVTVVGSVYHFAFRRVFWNVTF